MAAERTPTVEESIRQAMGDADVVAEESETEDAPAVIEADGGKGDEKEVESKEAEPEPSPEPEASDDKEEVEEDYEAPKFLQEEEREELKALPKEARALADRFVRRRDLALQRYVSKVQAQAQEIINQESTPFRELESVVTPHLKRLSLDRKDLASTVSSTLEWDQHLDENPLDALAQLCQRKGVTPRQLFDYMQGDGTDYSVVSSQGSRGTPSDDITRRLEAIERENQLLRESSVKSHWASVVNQIALSRDDLGQPKYPYYEDVRGDMSTILRLEGARNPGLQPQELFDMAYQKAVWANDNVRALMLSEQRTSKAAANLKKQRAGSSLPTSSNGSTSNSPKTPLSKNMSIEDSIRATIEESGMEF